MGCISFGDLLTPILAFILGSIVVFFLFTIRKDLNNNKILTCLLLLFAFLFYSGSFLTIKEAISDSKQDDIVVVEGIVTQVGDGGRAGFHQTIYLENVALYNKHHQFKFKKNEEYLIYYHDNTKNIVSAKKVEKP